MRVRVEVADTPYKLATGLMFRERLPIDAGMLFVFAQTRVLGFWGENTLIPLDIAFIGSDKKIAKIGRIEKLSKKNVSSDVPCRYAVEVNAGYFDHNDIKVGDSIDVVEDKYDGPLVVFQKNAGDGTKTAERNIKAPTATGRKRKLDPNQMLLPFMFGDQN